MFPIQLTLTVANEKQLAAVVALVNGHNPQLEFPQVSTQALAASTQVDKPAQEKPAGKPAQAGRAPAHTPPTATAPADAAPAKTDAAPAPTAAPAAPEQPASTAAADAVDYTTLSKAVVKVYSKDQGKAAALCREFGVTTMKQLDPSKYGAAHKRALEMLVELEAAPV